MAHVGPTALYFSMASVNNFKFIDYNFDASNLLDEEDMIGALFCTLFGNVTFKKGVASIQLPVKYPHFRRL